MIVKLGCFCLNSAIYNANSTDATRKNLQLQLVDCLENKMLTSMVSYLCYLLCINSSHHLHLLTICLVGLKQVRTE